MLQSIVV